MKSYSKDDCWWFSDEAYQEIGPYATEQDANLARSLYFKWQNCEPFTEEDYEMAKGLDNFAICYKVLKS